MLLSNLVDIRPGMVVGAVVLHPRRPELELLAAGTALDQSMLHRLADLGVGELWVRHDALADLDAVLTPRLTQLRREVYCQIKEGFAELEAQTITTAQLLAYRRAMLRLVFELVGNRRVAGLTEQLFSSDDVLFTHGTNVSYLAVLTGLELESYVIGERRSLCLEHARDVATLGLGAMLHDLGKLAWPVERRAEHEVSPGGRKPQVRADPPYRRHALEGFRLVLRSKMPATAKQVVLNHHQRYDGTGFPDMAEATANRRHGPWSGRSIHVFARIVAAANVLDNLLRQTDGRRRPPVAALYDFASPTFDGWFDPVVRQAMLRRLPPFQVGSAVRLSDGRHAAVLAPSPRQPCRPTVRILDHAARRPDGVCPTVDLERTPALRIAEWAGVDVRRWYFELPEGRARARAAG